MKTSTGELTKIVIGIQARSKSLRLPNKGLLLINGKPVIQYVIEACCQASNYLNRWSSKDLSVSVTVLVPEGDPIKEKVLELGGDVIEGPEEDVLSRYMVLINRGNVDYLCRVTGDCPMIPPYLISKTITLALMNGYDYVSNVDERVRTAIDGFDCEALSIRAMRHLDKTALSSYHREHVTIAIRENPPVWLKQGLIMHHLDQSHLMYSINTQEDFDRVSAAMSTLSQKFLRAVRIFGRNAVHKF